MGRKKTKTALTAAQYWEWRTTIEEMKTANLILENQILKFEGVKREWVSKINSAKEKVNAAEVEYKRIMDLLEKDLGTSLKNKIIDDINFGISDIPSEDVSDGESNNGTSKAT